MEYETGPENNLDKMPTTDLPFGKTKILKRKVLRKEQSYEDKAKLKEPILVLIKEDMTVEIKEGVTSGILSLKKGNKEEAIVTLSEKNLLAFKWGKASIRGWIAYIGEATPYPSEIKHDSERIAKIIDILRMNYKRLEKRNIGRYEEVGKFVLLLIGLAIAAFVLTPILTGMIGGESLTLAETIWGTAPPQAPPEPVNLLG